MNFLIKHKNTLIGIVTGSLLGFLYYYFWGCTGGCHITSSPVNSAVYGAIIGGLVVHSFTSK